MTLLCAISGNAVFAGDIQLIIDAGLFKTGSPTNNFLFIESANNLRSAGNLLAIQQGKIVGSRLLVASSDLFSRRMTQSNVDIFFSTIGDLSAASWINISLPNSYFASRMYPSASLIAISGDQMPGVSCQLVNMNVLRISCRILDAAPKLVILSGSFRLMFPAGQLTLGSHVPETSGGLTIQTSEDLPSDGARTPRISVPQVLSVQMKMSKRDAFANRTTTDMVELSFTIQSDLQVGGSITIVLPPSYFVAKVSPSAFLLCSVCSPIEVPNIQCIMDTKTLVIICNTSNFILRAGLVNIVFAAGEFSTGRFGGIFKTSGVRISASDHISSAMMEAPSIFCAAGQGTAKNGECQSCFPGEFSSLPNTEPCQLCPLTAYSSTFSSIECSTCGPSKSTGYVGAVAESECMCNDGLFLSNDLKCQPCSRGGVCTNSQMLSDKNFWSDSVTKSAQPIPCGFYPDACLAGSKCIEGHFGFLCSECLKGYFSVGGQCKRCDEESRTQSILIIVFFNISLLIMILLTIKGSSASINAFIQMLQIETLAMYIDTSKPRTVHSALRSLSVFSLNPELLMLECSMGVGDLPGDRQSSMILNFQIFILGCLVATYSLISLGLFCMIVHVLYNRQQTSLAKVGKDLSYISRQIRQFVTLTMHRAFACGLFIGLYVYLPVTVSIFQHISCNDVAGFSFIKMKPQISCNSTEWKNTVLPYCIVGFVLFTAGLPIMFTFMLLYTRKDRYNPMFLKSYAVFWNKYQPSLYWWEMVYTARKLMMACLIIILRDFYLFQATIFCVCWIAFMIVHFNTNPYEYMPLNRIESSFYLGAFFSVRAFVLYAKSWSLTFLQFLLTFFLRVSGDVEYRDTYVLLNLTITAAMIIYGMFGFVQELKQTFQSNKIFEVAKHFNSLGNHLKDENVC